MHARLLNGAVRFTRGSGLLLSCITSENIIPNTDATFHKKCRSYYTSIVGYRAKGPRSYQTRKSPRCGSGAHHNTSLISGHFPWKICPNISDSQQCRNYVSTLTDCLSRRHLPGELFHPATTVFISRDKSTKHHKRQTSSNTILQFKNTKTKRAKKKIVKAQERMKEKYEEIEERKENIFTIPNFLTTGRIVTSPVLGYLVIHEYFGSATLLFAVAGITDLLDGYIARNYPNQLSVLGSILDPLADKVLVGVLTITLTMVGLIPIPLTVLIVARDILLLGAAFVLRYKSLPSPFTLRRYFDLTHATVKLKPLLISKVNTNVQLVMVAASLAAPVFGYVDHPYLHALWYLTAGTTFISGLTYVFAKDTFKILSKRK
ncbi:putative cardiolipin synthase (CMP-forming) [Glandiceps talaboti]